VIETIADIVLIGPVMAGKTTLGRLLAGKLGLKSASLDATGWRYYTDAGLDLDRLRRLRDEEGELSSYRYFEQYLFPALERHLRESRGCVIDLGAGHSVYWNAADLARAKALLAPYRNVVHILPSPDLDASSGILRERTKDVPWLNRIREQSGFDLNDAFLRHRSNFELAKFTAYTAGKTPDEAADEILAMVAGPACGTHGPAETTPPLPR
jgi:shikimate kinase